MVFPIAGLFLAASVFRKIKNRNGPPEAKHPRRPVFSWSAAGCAGKQTSRNLNVKKVAQAILCFFPCQDSSRRTVPAGQLPQSDGAALPQAAGRNNHTSAKVDGICKGD